MSEQNIQAATNLNTVENCTTGKYEGGLKSSRPNNEKTNVQFHNYFYFAT
jgi:hypothetical protein